MKPTFIKGKWALIFNNLGQAVNDPIINLGILGLSLESHFDDFEGLHDEDL